MANTSIWNRPGDYNLIELLFVFNDNTSRDIIPNATQIELFEDIHSASVNGIIIFQDPDGMMEKYNIVGSEKIIFKMTTSLNDKFNDFLTIEKVFRVVKISDFINNGKEQFYTLHITTEITTINQNIKLSKSYNNYAETIIQTVYNETMGFEKAIFADRTKYRRKLVVPRMNPLKFFKYLADTSIPSSSDGDEDSGFVFYESMTGHHFKYLKGLYDLGIPFTLKEPEKNVSTGERSLDLVSNAYVNTMFNNMDNQMVGVFGSNIITHDILTKSIRYSSARYNGSLQPVPSDYNVNNRFSFMSSNYDSAQSNKWGLTSEKNKQLFDNYNLILEVYGNTNITVGQTVNYQQRTNVIDTHDERHTIFPTKHLITKVKHTMIAGVYTQTLELSSDRWYS